jgi:hypothetical protein
MRYKIIFLLLVVTGLYTACKKSELTKFYEADNVYIYKDAFNTSRDSILFSFAIRPAFLTVDTVKVPLRIMGSAQDRDRQVTVQVLADSSTAQQDRDFVILPTIIKAGEFTGFVPVLVKRSAAMKTAELRLMIQIGESADFKPGVPNSLPQSPRAGGSTKMLIKLNDYLTKPTNWDSFLTFFFGSYSQVKYAFVINTTGRSEFLTSGADPVSSSQMNYYKVSCRNELADYKAANGPLIDEFGLEVSFPN